MKTYLHTKDYFYSQEPYSLLEDEDMEMLITSPVPKNLETYYQSESYISHSDQSKSVIDSLYSFIKKYNLKKKVALLNSLLPQKGKLLDIGAGTGDFLLRAKDKNWDIYGVEPNALARQNATKKGILLNENIAELPEPTYDIITLWHVLEHMTNLHEQIKTITGLLNKDGFLIIAVPNYKSYDAQLYKQHWAAYDVPRHIWHFSKKSIMKLIAPYGLKLIDTKPMWFDSFYVSLLSEKYKTGRSNYLVAFLNGFISNIKGLSSQEYSSHIYILKKV